MFFTFSWNTDKKTLFDQNLDMTVQKFVIIDENIGLRSFVSSEKLLAIR